MMVLSALRPDASLPEFLAHRARSASIHRLSIDLAVGIAGSSAALWWRPSVWLVWRPSAWLVLVSLALCFACYGGWGLLDRARSRVAMGGNRLLSGSMEALCSLLGLVGALAAAGILLGLWASALGTWIS
jgi:hypothetical protein